MTSKLIASIDRAVCLTLDKRIKYARELCKDAKIYDIDLQLFIAGNGQYDLFYDHIDGTDLPPMIPGKSLQEGIYTWYQSPEMYNAFLCHKEIITKAYNDGVEVLLMMEDDAVFADDFDHIIEQVDEYFQNNNWDVIYLGSYVLHKDANIKMAPHIYQMIDDIGGFHGVIMKRRVMEIAKDFQPYETMDGLFCHSGFQEKFDMYFIDPSIINQKAGYSCTAGCFSNYKKVEPIKFDSIFGWSSFTPIYKQMVDECDEGIFVELGSYQGRSTVYMAEYLQIEKKNDIEFYAVDLWPTRGLVSAAENYSTDMFHEEELRISDNLSESLYHTFIHNLMRTNTINRVRMIRETSWLAADIFKDNSIYFLFIDAGHEYHQIKRDIIAWYPKIKIGGVIAGHDIASFEGVQKAVAELLPQAIVHELDGNSWFYRKIA